MVTRFPFLPRRHYKTALRLQTVSQGVVLMYSVASQSDNIELVEAYSALLT